MSCSGLKVHIAESVPNISPQNSAHVARRALESWLTNVLTAGPRGVPIVARKRSECSKALGFLNRRSWGDNTTVRMTSSTILEWSILVQAVKEMDYSTLPYRDEG